MCLTGAIFICTGRIHALHAWKLLAAGTAIDGVCGAHEALTSGVAESIKGRGRAGWNSQAG